MTRITDKVREDKTVKFLKFTSSTALSSSIAIAAKLKNWIEH